MCKLYRLDEAESDFHDDFHFHCFSSCYIQRKKKLHNKLVAQSKKVLVAQTLNWEAFW